MRLEFISGFIQILKTRKDLRAIKKSLKKNKQVTIGRNHQKTICAPTYISREQLKLSTNSNQDFTITQLSKNAVNAIKKIFRGIDDFIKIKLDEGYSQEQIEKALCFINKKNKINLPENFFNTIVDLNLHYLKLNTEKNTFEFCDKDDPSKLLSVQMCKEDQSKYTLMIKAVAKTKLNLSVSLDLQAEDFQNDYTGVIHEVILNPNFKIQIYNSNGGLHYEIDSKSLT